MPDPQEPATDEAGTPKPPPDEQQGFLSRKPMLVRLKSLGLSPTAFSRKGTAPYVIAGIVLLGVTILVPYFAPRFATLTDRLATLAALGFLLAAPGLVFRMGRRAFAVAFVLVLGLYALTAWTGFAFGIEDLFVIALITSFAIFTLAGFNLVFVIEEMVFDLHRLFHPRNRAWLALPTAIVFALAIGLPWWRLHGGPALVYLWIASFASSVLLAGWWSVRLLRPRGSGEVLRSLHLLAFTVIAATGLADGVVYLKAGEALLPSIVAYVALLGTWVYVSYTTLQRTHFLLRGRDAMPWISLMLSASFAIVAHAQSQVSFEGKSALQSLVGLRVNYMIIGVWIGLAFYGGHSVWVALRAITRTRRLGPRTRAVANQASRVVGGVVTTERLVESVAYRAYERLDRVIPGTSQPPTQPAPIAPQTADEKKFLG